MEVMCIDAEGHIDLRTNAVYQVVADYDMESKGLVRIVDDSGEDCIYSMSNFEVVLPGKILVTSECPSCKLSYTREEYNGMPWGVLALTMCSNCDNGEAATIKITERYDKPRS